MTTYHPCTDILIQGLKKLPGGNKVLAEWDEARAAVDNPSEYSVIYCPDVLLIRNIKRDSRGKFSSGWVVNGEWYLRREYNRFAAFDDEHSQVPVSVWYCNEDKFLEIQIPADFYGDYNYLIEVAEKFKDTGKWPKTPPKKSVKDYSDMDDDIPF